MYIGSISPGDRAAMNREMQIIREVNIEAEGFYKNAVTLGDHAAYALGREHRSQMTGLENIADTALKTSDIFDYIKRQTARFPYWQKNFPDQDPPVTTVFGKRLNDYLEDNLAESQKKLCSDNRLKIANKTHNDRHLRQHVYLLLIRQFIHQMVVQYEYRVSFLDKQEGSKRVNAHS
jgi:hypothetical protein